MEATEQGVQSTPSCCAASAVAEAMAGQAASQARLPHGGICFTRIVHQTNRVQLGRKSFGRTLFFWGEKAIEKEIVYFCLKSAMIGMWSEAS